MIRLPKTIQEAWEARDPAAVLTTISAAGVPNTIYVSCCDLVDGPRVLICDSHFGKTRENIKHGSPEVSFLFFAKDFAAYQLKGKVSYHTAGSVFEEGKAISKEEFGIQGVVEIKITEAYQGSEKLSD